MSAMKRMVDLVHRGPEDNTFYPIAANETIFQRKWPPHHNVVTEVTEIGHLGNAGWGSRITIPLRHKDTGDLLQWLCLRIKPRTWLGADLEDKLRCGHWDYADPSGAWMWAASLGTVAIAKVEFEIGDALIEQWGGDWMDVWSRAWMDASRAGTWDTDIYGQASPLVMRDTTREPWTTVQPTEDGYVYCWLPLTFLRRPETAFPLLTVGDQQEIRVHVTFRPFADVVRRRARVRVDPAEVPLGEQITVLDKTGLTPVPWIYTLPPTVPTFEEFTVLAGVVQMEDPLRTAYLKQPLEMMYEVVTHSVFDLPKPLEAFRGVGALVNMMLPLKDLNGPIRELCWFVRRKKVWQNNEWTNYGTLMEEVLVDTVDTTATDPEAKLTVYQVPLLRSARLWVDNAIWRDEAEEWWRAEYGLAHRGGVRLASGMVYGFVLGDAAGWAAEDLQPAGTINASRADLRLELAIQPPPFDEDPATAGWEVHVFGIGLNWLRFNSGMAVPLFKD